jgi:microcystin-dependent protein
VLDDGAPDIELVLQGEGVSVDVVGRTIVKHGVLSAAFSSLPDVPISTLGLVLGAGPHSLLAANLPAKAHGSLCGQSLSIATELTGQNGAVVKHTTKLAVSGCPKRRRRLRV